MSPTLRITLISVDLLNKQKSYHFCSDALHQALPDCLESWDILPLHAGFYTILYHMSHAVFVKVIQVGDLEEDIPRGN